MPKQPAFPSLRDAMKKKQTRRELFLAEMDSVVPWGRVMALVNVHLADKGITLRSGTLVDATITLFALGNLFLMRRKLMACGQVCLKMGGLLQKRPRNLEISGFCPKGASPQRSDGHLGEAEGVDQTFLSLSVFQNAIFANMTDLAIDEITSTYHPSRW